MNKKGFTIAEVLIVLGIIGIIAEITIPTLIKNFQNKSYLEALKENYSMLNNGFGQMMGAEGVTTMSDTQVYSSETGEEFLSYMKKYFKIVDYVSYPDEVANGVPSGKLSGDTCKQWVGKGYMISYYLNDNTKCYGVRQTNFKLVNGAILNMTFTPYPEYSSTFYAYHPDAPGNIKQCVGELSIDVNGLKPPNKWGRDSFQFIIAQNGLLYARGEKEYAIYCQYIYNQNISNYISTDDICDSQSTLTGTFCAGEIINDDWQMNY